MSVLLTTQQLGFDVTHARPARRHRIDGMAATTQAVFERITEDMNDNRSLVALTDEGRRCAVAGYGVMRDGSTYVTVVDSRRTGDDAFVTLPFNEFIDGFIALERAPDDDVV